MTVETPERAWTDPRLDDLSRKVDNGFAKVDVDIGELRGDLKEVCKKMEAGFARADARMESGFARFDKKFDRLMWGLVTVGGVIISALIRSHAL